MRAWDAPTADAIQQAFNHWDDIELHFKGRVIRSGGHGFVGIGRKKLLNILQARCEALGVKLVFETEVDADTDYPRRRPDHRQRRHQLEDPWPLRRRLQARHRDAAQPLHLARHQQAVRRVHLPVREDRARLVSGPHLQVRRHDVDLHRRMPRARVEGAWPGSRRPGPVDRLLRAAVRAQPARREADDQRAPPARLGVAQFPAHHVRAVVALQRSQPRGADGRRGAHRALRDRLGHQARARRRDRADVAVQAARRHGRAHSRGARALPGRARGRRGAAAERGVERDGVVRGRAASATATSSSPSSSCTRC